MTGLTGREYAEDERLFHAGTKREGADCVNRGGRVVAATVLDADLKEAARRSLALAQEIRFEGAFCRRDLAQDL